jgi:adenylate kinase family enzyme
VNATTARATPPTIGRRIVVYGWTGSGKTTMSRRIGAALGLSVIELDAIFWSPGGWRSLEVEDFRSAALEAIASCTAGWVCEGNYTPIRQSILPLADTVVWLRLPFRVTYARVWRRTIRRMITREPLWGSGNRESWRLSFASRDSLLLYAFTQRRHAFRSLIADLEAHGQHAQVIELRSAREVDAFLRSLSVPGVGPAG